MKYLASITYVLLFVYWPDNPEFHLAFIGGIIRATGANKMAKRLQRQADAINPVRPEYQIPQEVQDYLNNAINAEGGDMPGYGRMLDQAYGNTATTLNTARNFAGSGNDLLQTLAGTSVNERRNVNDINMQNLGFRANNRNALNEALLRMGGYQDQAFDYNENQPYIQEEADKRAYTEAAINQKTAANEGWASLVDGVVNTAVAIGTAGTGSGGASMFSKLFGGGK